MSLPRRGVFAGSLTVSGFVGVAVVFAITTTACREEAAKPTPTPAATNVPDVATPIASPVVPSTVATAPVGIPTATALPTSVTAVPAPSTTSRATAKSEPHVTTTASAAPVPSSSPAATATATVAAVAPVAPSPPRVTRQTTPHYTLTVTAPGDCTKGSLCMASLVVEALGEYHVNKEYPYKFKGDENPSLTFQGQSPSAKNVFSRSTGDFKETSATTASMSVRFTSTADVANLSGTYGMSVCSASNCELASPRVALDVPMK
ncbi:MAG: hypothetical protein U0169_26610 [Polyangiaceae bacterium]